MRKICTLLVVVLLVLSLGGCQYEVETEKITLEIYPEKDYVQYNEQIVVTAKNVPTDTQIRWYVNGNYKCTANRLEFSAGQADIRYRIHATFDNAGQVIESEVCDVYVTSQPALMKAVYNFIDKYNIKTAVSVAVKKKDMLFSMDAGFTSLTDETENTDETLHYVYSITKTFTAATILHLAEAEQLSLTDKVSTYIDNLDSLYVNGDATIAELLTHTSGIQDYVNNPALFYSNPFINKEWNPDLLLPFVQSPATERGFFSYSSTNFVLLGMIMEKVTGKTASSLIAELFLAPLNLESVKLPPQDIVNNDVISHPHVYPGTDLSLVGNGETPVDISTVIPNVIDLLGKSSWTAGGMVACASDIARWGYDLYSNYGKTDVSVRNRIYESVRNFNSTDADAYGYGVRKIFYGDEWFVGSYGRSVGSENCMFYNPTHDICITILTSSNADKKGLPDIDELLFSLYEVSL